MRADAWSRVVLAVLGASCSGGESRCLRTNLDGLYSDDRRDAVCLRASMFAARDTLDLVPSQPEVDRYFERLARAVEAEPLILHSGPQPYRAELPAFAHLYTTNEAVIQAWQGLDDVSAPRTGDPGVDAILEELAPTLYHVQTSSTGETYVGLGTDGVFNEEVLHERLLATSSRLEAPVDRSGRADMTWSWDDGAPDAATATLSIRLGWSDCIAGCRFFHELRAVVPPTGAATVFDLGGDPLPEGWELRPTTQPPR